VKAYAVSAHELDTLTYWNTLASVFFSIATGLLTFGVGTWISVWVQPGAWSSNGEVMAKVIFPICVVLAFVFYAIGILTLVVRSSTVKTIKNESRASKT